MPAKKTTATKPPSKPAVTEPLTAMPQSKQAAAAAAKITLKTDDSWSQAYWSPGDLHCRERELFG